VVIASTGRTPGGAGDGNWAHPDAFDLEDQNLLAVGEQAAIVNNARMIKALEEREERLAIQNETLARQNRELELTRQQIERQNLTIEAARLKSLATYVPRTPHPYECRHRLCPVLLRQRTATLVCSNMVQRILNNGKTC